MNEKLQKLARKTLDSGGTLNDIAKILKITEEQAAALAGVDVQYPEKASIPYGREFDDEVEYTSPLKRRTRSRRKKKAPGAAKSEEAVSPKPFPDLPSITEVVGGSWDRTIGASIDEIARPFLEIPDKASAAVKESYNRTLGRSNGLSDLESENLNINQPRSTALQEAIKKRNSLYKSDFDRKVEGVRDAALQGLTFSLSDEIAGAVTSFMGGNYDDAAWQVRDKLREFRRLNPGLSVTSELLGGMATGTALSSGLAKAGVKNLAAQGAADGALYGFGSGNNIEQRLKLSAGGAMAGAAVGQVLQLATRPASAGGFKTTVDDAADAEMEAMAEGIKYTPVERVDVGGQTRYAERIGDEAYDTLEYTNARGQRPEVKPWREATNAGELVDGLLDSAIRFYDDYWTPASDFLIRRVSPEWGARYQRADESALRFMGRAMQNVIEPLAPVVRLANEDIEFKRLVINYAANQASKQSVRRYIKDKLDQDAVNAFDRYTNWSQQRNQRNNSLVAGRSELNDPNRNYLHTQLTDAAKAARQGDEAEDILGMDTELALDVGAFKQLSEGRLRGEFNPTDYKNPFLTDMQRIFHNERMIQMAEKLDLPMPTVKTTAKDFMDNMEQVMIQRGINPRAAAIGRKAIIENIKGQNQSPNTWIQGLQSLGYAGSLAGPKSAFLNIHDIPQSVAHLGVDSLRGLRNKTGVSLEQFGLSQQNVGEFMNRIQDELNQAEGLGQSFANMARKGNDLLMKGSLFAAMDGVGKRGVMNMILRRAETDARAGDIFERWGFYFDPKELRTIQYNLIKHGSDYTKYSPRGRELIEELVAAGLGQQQLISGAGRSAGWARHPNLRPLWALRGFAMKQQALALRNTYGNWEAGKTDEALDYLKRYTLFAAGGFGLLNEARQAIWGDGEASITGVLVGMADQMTSVVSLNTIGLNDYQYGRMMESGIVPVFLESLVPVAVSVPYDIGKNQLEGISDPEVPITNAVERLPFIKQNRQALENTGFMDLLR